MGSSHEQSLVPTPRVGTQVCDALRRVFWQEGTQSVPDVRSHAERGNESERTCKKPTRDESWGHV